MPEQPSKIAETIELGYKNILSLIMELRFKELTEGNHQFDLDKLDPLTVELIGKIISRMYRQEGVGYYVILHAIEMGCDIEQLKKICTGSIIQLNDVTCKDPIDFKEVSEAMRNVNAVARKLFAGSKNQDEAMRNVNETMRNVNVETPRISQ